MNTTLLKIYADNRGYIVYPPKEVSADIEEPVIKILFTEIATLK